MGDGGQIFHTGDLFTWLPAASPGTSANLNGIFQLNNVFVATGAGGTLMSSPDGDTWTPLPSNTLNTLRGAAFCGLCTSVQYVAVGDAGTIITSSDNRVTWQTVPPPFAQDLTSVTVGGASGTRFLAVGRGGAVAYMDDGGPWKTATSGSANLNKVLFAPGMYISVGDAGANAVSR